MNAEIAQAPEALTAPLISVILPTHNRARFLPDAIASVLAQTWPNWELWVMDDGSTDDTADILAGYDDPRIHYVSLPKQPCVGAVRNAGIARARGEYLAFLDSDDVYEPDALEILLRETLAHPDKVLVEGFYRSVDIDLQVTRTLGVDLVKAPGGGYALPPGFTEDWLALLDTRVPISPCLGLFRRTLLETVGLFREDLQASEDYELLVRIYRHFPGRIGHVPHYILRYRIQPQSVTKDPGRLEAQVAANLHALSVIFDDPALPAEARRLRPYIHARWFRRFARAQLNLCRPALARHLAWQAGSHPAVSRLHWLRELGPIVLQSYFPRSLYQGLASLNRAVRLQLGSWARRLPGRLIPST